MAYDYLIWGIVLSLCGFAWGIVLCIGIVDRARRQPYYGKAEQRAATLLKEWLTPDQCLQYDRRSYFEVKGSYSGKRYRIRYASQINVDQLDDFGRRVATLCFLPEKSVPVGDIMLAQKIMLENHELAALRVAIRHP